MGMVPLSKILTVVLVAVLALAMLDAAEARSNKPRVKRTPIAVPTVLRDHDGTPIITKNRHPTYGIADIMQVEKQRPARAAPLAHVVPPAHVARPVTVPRGSSTYVPSPVPSPNSPSSPPPAVLLQPPLPAVYPPPAANSFNDRVINCIHSAPLNTGVGNNPANSQANIRQCAN